MATPLRSDAPASSVLSVRLTPRERAQLDAVALAAGVTAADLVRGWIAAGGAARMPGRSRSPAPTAPDSSPEASTDAPPAPPLEVAPVVAPAPVAESSSTPVAPAPARAPTPWIERLRARRFR